MLNTNQESKSETCSQGGKKRKNKGIQLESVPANIIYGLAVLFAAFAIEEMAWNEHFFHIEIKYMLTNCALIVIAALCMILIFASLRTVYIILVVFNWIYGLINFYVMKFKGHPPLFTDIFAAKTAISVMGSYDYSPTKRILGCSLSAVFLVIILLYVRPKQIRLKTKSGKVRIGFLFFRACVPVTVIICCYHVDLFERFNLKISQWSPEISFQEYGAPLAMYISMQNSKIKKPNEYSEAEVSELLSTYQLEIENESEEITRPLIIAIMNETFSDIGVLGSFESDEYLSYWNSIDSYVMRGNLYVSVCSGGTCNTEFEFLTGSSMANIESGLYPYASYDLSSAFSITEYLAEEYQYNTIAYHPNSATNWNRKTVYRNFGFDTFLSFDDMDTYTCINWGVSDESDYAVIEELVDSAGNQPMFIFNVTMQNHGGYTNELQIEDDLVEIEDKYATYTDVINYLTLIRESDRAFEELITYLESVEYPVVVCMFGDHQPGIDANFIAEVSDYSGDSEIEAAQQRYITQYIIWSNYDVGIHDVQTDMSANYLGANLMNITGNNTAYTNYLMDLEKEIPIINTIGYQTKDGTWHNLSESNEYLEEYKKVQYYELFGNKNK